MKDTKEAIELRVALLKMTGERDKALAERDTLLRAENNRWRAEQARDEEREFMREIVRAAVGAPPKRQPE